MNPKYLIGTLILFLTLGPARAEWNAVTVSDTVVSFGQVLCSQPHSVNMNIQNNSLQVVNVLDATFEEAQFSTDLTPTSIPAGGSIPFTITFESDQNVDYQDLLVIDLDSGIHPLVIMVTASGVFENSYYSGTRNLYGSDLKQALHNKIKNHTELSYSGVWSALKDTDEDPDNTNNVILLYTGWSYKKSDQNTGDQNGWNREHVWAKSHGDFGTSAPAGTDIHHLRPADVTVNSKRGSLDFDDGGSLYTDDNGVTGCYYDSDSWEPRAEVKGDVARMMYYMVVRYEGDDTSYDLELVDRTPSTSSKEPIFGKQSTLYAWHNADPVSDWERRRNDRIDSNWQHNRNPFIDYPQFADRLPSISGVPLVSEPEIVFLPAQAEIPETPLNESADYYLLLSNTGNQTLNVTNISSSDSHFSVEPSSVDLPAETWQYVHVIFSGAAQAANYAATITVQSNDPDEPNLTCQLQIAVNDGSSLVGEQNLPGQFELMQNYPNPFNPSTTIPYALPQVAADWRVNLIVYDIAGNRVQSLLQEHQPAGMHRIRFQGRGLSSGVYFYRLMATAGSRQLQQVRKMFLLR